MFRGIAGHDCEAVCLRVAYWAALAQLTVTNVSIASVNVHVGAVVCPHPMVFHDHAKHSPLEGSPNSVTWVSRGSVRLHVGPPDIAQSMPAGWDVT